MKAFKNISRWSQHVFSINGAFAVHVVPKLIKNPAPPWLSNKKCLLFKEATDQETFSQDNLFVDDGLRVCQISCPFTNEPNFALKKEKS
jgi:hypothetical protein